MEKKLTLTKDHIKLINLINPTMIGYKDSTSGEKKKGIFIDKENPYVLLGRLSDIAIALDMMDKAIPGTEYAPEGYAFPEDVEKYMLEVHHYIIDHILDIEVLIHQMVCVGGITEGEYVEVDGIWKNIWNKDING